MRTVTEIKATGATWVTESELTWLCEQLDAAQAIITAARDLPEFFEATGRTHSFVPLLDVLDASNPAKERP